MSRKRRLGLVVGLMVLMLAMAPTALANHHWSGHSVDDNRRIVYINYSKYDFLVYHARDVWNQGGKVSIVPENQGEGINGTLEWYHTNRCDVTWGGQFTDGWAWWVLDKISLNECQIDGYGLFNGQKIAAHEQGHGLALDDHTYSDCPANCLMYYSTNQPYNAPAQHDWNDYHYRWP